MSRSATVVCAYVLATTNLSPSETIDFVVSRRCVVAPNTGFRKQLEQYYLRLHPDAKPPPSRSRSSKSPRNFSMNIGRLRLWRSTSINVAAAQSARTKDASDTAALQRYRTAESPKASKVSLTSPPRELRVDEPLHKG